MASRTHSVSHALQLTLGRTRRFGRLLVFGFELLVLTRLMERHRRFAQSVTATLLKTKAIETPPPELAVTGPDGAVGSWSHGFTAAYAALFLNLRNPSDLSPSRHALPAPPFRAVYLWDSAFIAQVWKWWDADVSWDVLRSVIELRDGDRFQHFASEFTRSEFSQPPLVAWSLQKLGEAASPVRYQAWLERAYAPLCDFHRWLCRERRLPNGLFAWAHAYESGVENAPRFSSRDERRSDDTRALAAPDFSTYMVLQTEALASMADRLGRKSEAMAFRNEADALRDAVNRHLWDEQQGLYFDRDIRNGSFVRRSTIASLLPLWAGIPDKRQAQRLCQHILDPAGFNTLIPLPTVALSDDAFERDMWRGPVWANTAYAVIEGLKRYGFFEIAADLAFRLCDGIYRAYGRTGRFYEFYDPTSYDIRLLHRKRGNRWKRVTLGSGPVVDFVGWTGLVNTLVIDLLFGVQRTADGLAIQPRLPSRAQGLRFCLSLPGFDLKIDLETLPERATRGIVTRASGSQEFTAAFGELTCLDPKPVIRAKALP